MDFLKGMDTANRIPEWQNIQLRDPDAALRESKLRYCSVAGETVKDPEYSEKLDFVYCQQRIRCIASDGLNVLENIAGYSGLMGYLEMLEVIRGKDREAAAEMRKRARDQGRTGRKVKPENML